MTARFSANTGQNQILTLQKAITVNTDSAQ
ncbi:hypothetical protein FHS67_000899 [Aminobacter aminovorans]|uniref:Uncharacterized protein n=1 Tax=Aminobacter aminovorans TaxID=83263 RepID=A0AAC9AS40_AMIAI|nr:hypothetical protein AA2016_3830 [Aminobacter aminovorans]MBB3704596.1 hypothetical protein [Aminobacter aminovorans]